MDLPHPDDTNYPNAAKIWLVNCGNYNKISYKVTGWDMENWLFDNWPGLINYKQDTRPSGEINCDYGSGGGTDNPNCTDNDGDGYFVEASGCDGEDGFVGHNDCDDNNASIYPGAVEICDDGLDNDCDGLVDCDDDDCDGDSACNGTTSETVTFMDLKAIDQYGYDHNYAGASVNFTYVNPGPVSGKLTGSMTASGLKPFATYQVKFEGKPICATDGINNLANEYIGYRGRWTCVSGATCMGNASDRNRTDAQYEARSYFKGDSSECIVGYLVFDHITADASGNVVKYIETANSYRVLWCSGGTCDDRNNNQLNSSANPPVFSYCVPSDVNGQIERFTCDGLILDSGNYDLKMILTEECFHQPGLNWTAVMDADVNFVIN
jgi:hypothetical protein